MAAPDPIDRVSARSDFIVPVHPAISRVLLETGAFIPTNEWVCDETPLTFLVHTHEDNLSSLHGVRFYHALGGHPKAAKRGQLKTGQRG